MGCHLPQEVGHVQVDRAVGGVEEQIDEVGRPPPEPPGVGAAVLHVDPHRPHPGPDRQHRDVARAELRDVSQHARHCAERGVVGEDAAVDVTLLDGEVDRCGRPPHQRIVQLDRV